MTSLSLNTFECSASGLARFRYPCDIWNPKSILISSNKYPVGQRFENNKIHAPCYLPKTSELTVLDCLHDNHTKQQELSISLLISFEIGFFKMFHLPELVEDICFQSLYKVSQFPTPLFNQWKHINNTSSQSLLCLRNLLNLNVCEGSRPKYSPSL